MQCWGKFATKCVYVIFYSYLTGIFSVMSKTINPADFFNISDGNLTKITWAHAVNNRSYLQAALQDKNIMMLEADIVIGKLINGTDDDIPIMGHPPATTSDLSLKDFLLQTSQTTQKGIKLDFKSLDALQKAVSDLEKCKEANYPIFLNADILPGPIDAPQPVNATEFLKVAKNFESFTLSLGWSTLSGDLKGSYTDDQIDEMTKTIKENQVTQDITFPVRAGFAAESLDQMRKLVNAVENSTLTLWSSQGDYIDVENLKHLIDEIGIKRVYVDLPHGIL